MLFPAHLVGDAVAGSCTRTRTRTRTSPARELVDELAEAHRLGPLSRLSTVAVGGRHPALVRASLTWAGRRTWNGRTLTTAGIAVGCLRLAMGLPGAFPVDEAVGIISWALRCRAAWAALGWQASDSYRAKQARRIRTRWAEQQELIQGRVSEVLKLRGAGLSQVEIARSVDCSQTTVSRILAANRTTTDHDYSLPIGV